MFTKGSCRTSPLIIIMHVLRLCVGLILTSPLRLSFSYVVLSLLKLCAELLSLSCLLHTLSIVSVCYTNNNLKILSNYCVCALILIFYVQYPLILTKYYLHCSPLRYTTQQHKDVVWVAYYVRLHVIGFSEVGASSSRVSHRGRYCL